MESVMGFVMRTRVSIALAVILASALSGRAVLAVDKPAGKKVKPVPDRPASDDEATKKEPSAPPKIEEATFGSGCFWCAEAVFQQLKGVESVVSGYSGGTLKNPTYEQVSTDLTGHAEVVHITFDPDVISYDDLLEVFWKSHDPTKLNEQGPDHGTRYRSVIFYHSDEQKELAEKSKQKHTRPGRTAHKIVTEITKFSAFYPAEDYHQNYFKNNPRDGYCQINARPKVNKVRKEFKDLLKDPPAKK
jgi:peptide-methionine (S)-S-oxide reductase